MKTCDCLIIGGGIVGLTLAREWLLRYPQSKVVVLEEGANSVAHGTGRNSGVVHSGIYYAEEFAGKVVRVWCSTDAPVRRGASTVERSRGKLLVPPTESSLSSVDVLLNRGRANGVEIHKVTGREALELEPRVNTKFGQALYVPITSVVNPRKVAERVREEVVSRGGVIHYSTPAEAIDARRGTARTSTGSFEAGDSGQCGWIIR